MPREVSNCRRNIFPSFSDAAVDDGAVVWVEDEDDEDEENQSNAFSISVFDQRYGPCDAACVRRLLGL